VDYEGKRLAKFRFKVKRLTCLFLIFAFTVVSLSLLPSVRAGIEISLMTPASGTVGTPVQLTGNLTTADGIFEIRFDDDIVAGGNAAGNHVNASFTVPHSAAGNHTVKITDVATGENGTKNFTVSTFYNMTIDVPLAPKQLQEGDSIPISVNITGGESSKTYVANVTVLTPANMSFVKMLNITTTTIGNGTANTSYPNDFSADANTHVVGDYSVSFNTTISNMTFFVGLTNSTEYHRGQAVDIKVVYKPNENVTITVTGKDVYDSLNLTADNAGIVHYANFTVPANASIGNYTVNVFSISAVPTTKSPADTQDFTVPGFAVNVTAKNLAGDSVPDVTLRAFENATSVSNVTTGSDGVAILELEIGDYRCEAYSKAEKVGEREIAVTNVTSVDLLCNLTNLGVRVIGILGGAEIGIPEAGIHLTPDNTMFMTDVTGIAVAHSLLPNITYTLNTSRYSVPFNVTTIPQLLVNEKLVAWVNVTIICPTVTLQVNVTKADGQPIGNALVKVQESLGGIHYEGNTDPTGMLAFNPVFGRYNIGVYDSSGIKLNETAVDLFQNQNVTIYCNLYGLAVSVRVVDYFGQPFPNVNIALQREGSEAVSKRTQADGTATFDNLVGGNFEVAVYLTDETQPTVAQVFLVENSTTVQIKIDKYVMLVGLLIETSQLTIAIIIALTVILVVSLEVYRRRRPKPKKSES